ncbi:MAG: ATP-dependent Clp protease ATP-binding subunit [Chloroflexi bacterium]|nr:ATP-dependent Clp protease ATP-binding subunit [Chloroflexota bacterium]MCY3581640.1 ATP-dependent Clp protease ATP-binding subunit [Chloroflexota bacterium]MCY3717014.1 ATP-dependent Clp protease ATP-binding subunit [Chloroflexota bacterium]MDE2652165.1 ATP-dependent Clp protease ATP-binding subunit [Chloroflexota bacterium]MXX51608.1 ATP-dependent Clp protease ATP-binding subunit [Chloroflexota bacterium]
MPNKMERFTQRARRVLSLAQEEAERLRHHQIGTEHLLLGLMREEGGVAGRVLRDLGLDLRRVEELVSRLSTSEYRGGVAQLDLSPGTKKVLELAVDEARRMGHHYIGTEHLLLGLVRQQEGIALDVLRRLGVNPEEIRRQTSKVLQESPVQSAQRSQQRSQGKSSRKNGTPLVDQLSTDLTSLAESGKLDPVVGREMEIERVIQVLSRRRKNNPALIGEPGVGKTAIVEGLAQRIVEGETPKPLLRKRVLQLDVGSLVAGTMYRGQFEERLKRVIEELKKSDTILFIDEVHMLVGAGAAGSSVDAANILKPALARGELQCIGATTLEEYRKHVESDAALERRFQQIQVAEPTIEETIEILQGIKSPYQDHHNVEITDDAIETAANLSARYIPDRYLPDKAIDLIDEAAARLRMYKSPDAASVRRVLDELAGMDDEIELAEMAGEHGEADNLRRRQQSLSATLDDIRVNWNGETGQPRLLADDISEVAAMWTGIPVTRIANEESERLLEMEEQLHERIVGQHEAIVKISRAVRRARAGLKDPRRPIGSFMFLGPTGVGKTELTKALAEFLFGSEDALIQLDMSEFMERHSVARLVGAPPGYVGYDDAGQLTEAVRRRPYSIIVFDEVEKAHPEVFNMLLQMMEEGTLTDARGRRVDFRNAMLVMTSNVGADLIKPGSGLGFTTSRDINSEDDEAYEDMSRNVTDQLQRLFRPEFLNRVDATIIFRSLSRDEIKQIVDLELNKVRERLLEHAITLEADDSALGWLGDHGYNPEFGARPLRRLIQNEIEDRLSDGILTGEFGLASIVRIEVDEDGGLALCNVEEAEFHDSLEVAV